MTGLEPAASGVTGQRSNQLSYTPAFRSRIFHLETVVRVVKTFRRRTAADSGPRPDPADPPQGRPRSSLADDLLNPQTTDQPCELAGSGLTGARLPDMADNQVIRVSEPIRRILRVAWCCNRKLDPCDAPGVRGRRKEQILNGGVQWWAVTGSNRRPTRCKRVALPAELTALRVLYQLRECCAHVGDVPPPRQCVRMSCR